MSLTHRVLEKARAQASSAIDAGSILGGLCRYYAKGVASQKARGSILRLHCATNGKTSDRLASLLRVMRPPRQPKLVNGFIGELTVEKQSEIVNAIRRDGYYVFENRLSKEVCDALENFATITPAIVEGHEKEERRIFDPAMPLAKKYYFPEQELIANPGMQQLMGDPSLLAVAEQYLNTHPVLSDVTLWWSAVHAGSAGADAGQYFHFDFDPPPRWLMIFVYLTDVDARNGPHVYVRGSHLNNHAGNEALRHRGYVRIPDSDIVSTFGSESIVELHGKRGTILAVDTMGFHRGMPLVSGHRLMGQLIYGFAQFAGSQASRLTAPNSVHPILSQALKASPRVYQKYT